MSDKFYALAVLCPGTEFPIM